jgi:hypothetical protein
MERFGDRRRRRQPLAQPGRAACRRVALRREAGRLLEEAVEVVRAELDRLGQPRSESGSAASSMSLQAFVTTAAFRRIDGDSARVCSGDMGESRPPRPRRGLGGTSRSSDSPGATDTTAGNSARGRDGIPERPVCGPVAGGRCGIQRGSCVMSDAGDFMMSGSKWR